jgi:hypothetical protein
VLGSIGFLIIAAITYYAVKVNSAALRESCLKKGKQTENEEENGGGKKRANRFLFFSLFPAFGRQKDAGNDDDNDDDYEQEDTSSDNKYRTPAKQSGGRPGSLRQYHDGSAVSDISSSSFEPQNGKAKPSTTKNERDAYKVIKTKTAEVKRIRSDMNWTRR